MSVKIEWQIFEAETRNNGTWKSNSPALEELLNAIASSEKIREHTQDVEYSMALLAVKALPYFKIKEVNAEKPGKKSSINLYNKTSNSKARSV